MTELSPFFEVYVKPRILGTTTIFWGMQRWFNDPAPYTFTVEWAEAASSNNWAVVNNIPIIDDYWAEDDVTRMFAKEAESYYRVKLVTTNGEYTSVPQQATGSWDKRDWLIARDIMRKEKLRLEKQVGEAGYLLKRKLYGNRCNVCVEYDTDDVYKSDCAVCFGTGFTGGYFPAYPYMVSKDVLKYNKEHADEKNTTESVVAGGRGTAYPHVSTYDIWVSEKTDERWVVRTVDHAAEIRGHPIVYNLELRLAPFTDPIYKVGYIPPEPVYNDIEDEVETPGSEEAMIENMSVYPTLPEGAWLWFDSDNVKWVFSSGAAVDDIYYFASAAHGGDHRHMDQLSWNVGVCEQPVPVVEIISNNTLDVIGAACTDANGVYNRAGYVNGAYLFTRD